MGNQLGDLHPPGYSDEEKFQFVENMVHPFLGQIQILKLAKKPKSINTQNVIIQTSSENQLFVNVQTQIPKLVLMHIIQGIIKLQKVRRESVLALTELGQIAQIVKGHKGIIFEFEKYSLASEILQRQHNQQCFSEKELLYIIETLVSTSKSMIEIPHMGHILKNVQYKSENIYLTEKRTIKISNYIIYLCDSNVQQKFLKEQESIYDISKSANEEEKKKIYSELFLNLNRRKKQEARKNEEQVEEQVDVSDPKIQEIQKKSVYEIGQLILQLCSVQQSGNYGYDDIEHICQDYSDEFKHIMKQMLNKNTQDRSNFSEIILDLDIMKRKNEFVTCLTQNDQLVQSKTINLQSSKDVSNQDIRVLSQVQQKYESKVSKIQNEESIERKYTNLTSQKINLKDNKVEQEGDSKISKPVALIDKHKIMSLSPKQIIQRNKQKRNLNYQQLPNIKIKIEESTVTKYGQNHQAMQNQRFNYQNYMNQFQYQRNHNLYKPNYEIDQRVNQALIMSQQVLNSYASKIYSKDYNQKVIWHDLQKEKLNNLANNQSQVVRIDNSVQESNIYMDKANKEQFIGYQNISNQEFDDRFWKIVRDAKQQVLRCETNMNVGIERRNLG